MGKKYIRDFATEAEYNSWKTNNPSIKPSVAYCKDTGKVKYNPAN